MIWLIILAGFMAIFGVIGYLRGTRAAFFILILALFGVALTGPLGSTIIQYINAFAKGFRFLLSGGLAALAGSGNPQEAIQALQNTPPLVQPEDQGLVLGLLFIIIMLVGILMTSWKVFRPQRSILGLFIGLTAGYFVGAIVLRALNPAAAAFLPLPGQPAPAVPVPAPGDTTQSATFSARVVEILNSLADKPMIGAAIAISIALFVLIATRASNRSVKKG